MGGGETVDATVMSCRVDLVEGDSVGRGLWGLSSTLVWFVDTYTLYRIDLRQSAMTITLYNSWEYSTPATVNLASTLTSSDQQQLLTILTADTSTSSVSLFQNVDDKTFKKVELTKIKSGLS